VRIASLRFVIEDWSFTHSRMSGRRSPRYGLIASALIFDISDMTVNIDDTSVEVARSPSSFLIRHNRIDVE